MLDRHRIGVLSRTLGSSLLLLAALTGCEKNSTTAPGIPPSRQIYVVNSDSRNVTAYPAASSGDVAPSGEATPIRVIKGDATRLGYAAGLALDGTGRIYVANSGGSVTVYSGGANGDAAPSAIISGPGTGLDGPRAVALDHAGRIYVANWNSHSITVYAPDANGDATPTAT